MWHEKKRCPEEDAACRPAGTLPSDECHQSCEIIFKLEGVCPNNATIEASRKNIFFHDTSLLPGISA